MERSAARSVLGGGQVKAGPLLLEGVFGLFEGDGLPLWRQKVSCVYNC